jgi:type I restriction enzyme S subunit
VSYVRTGPFGSTLHERDYVDFGTPIITVEHLSEYGIVHENLPLVSDSDKLRLKSYSLRENDIVFSRVGSVDRNSLVTASEEGWLFSGRLLRVRISNNIVHPPFLSYYFHSEPFKNRIRGVAVGQTMASLNTQILNDIQVVIPPLPEQHAIAAALSDVDGLIRALDALISKKRDMKQAAMQQLLTGRTRLPGFANSPKYKKTEIGVIPEDWVVQSISGFCSTYSGGTPNTSQSEFYGGSIPWITSGDLNKRRIKDVAGCITQKGFDSSAAQMVNKGDIIIALYGATAGVVATWIPANS